MAASGLPGDGYFDGFLDDYFAECEEHLTGARRVLLSLEDAAGRALISRPAVDELFRIFHSLKGISAMVELRAAEQIAHELESYLRLLRERGAVPAAEGLDTLFLGTQRLEDVIAAKRFDKPEPAIGDVLARVEALLAAAPPAAVVDADANPAAGAVNRLLCTFVPTRELLARGVGVDAIRKRLAALGRIERATPHVSPDGSIRFEFEVTTEREPSAFEPLRGDGVAIEAMRAEDPKADGGAGAWPSGAETSPANVAAHVVRVDLKRLDDLMQSVGDLVISRARLAESLARIEPHVPAPAWRAVQDNAAVIDRQLRTLREGIMRVRLVPIGEIFRRMPFVVRDLARENGKRVRLDLQGQSTEIDKFVIERMMDPVLHLVRNAVSHGIEPPDERIAAGKPPDATITLAAATVGDTVRIEIADDGRGIDAERVVQRAVGLGMAVPPGPTDAATLLSLICAPGFSTRDETDRVSGRGVGMSVVKSAIEELSGRLSLATSPGSGTTFVIELPLTLAITDALIAQVGGETFAVPQSAVREVFEVNAAEVRILEQSEIAPFRGAALPLVRLSRVFAIDAPARERLHVFVTATVGAPVGLIVDRIVGQREIVVRTIADPLVRANGISGATDLGDGRVVLILDPTALARGVRAPHLQANHG